MRRRGLTMIECLVVISVIAILIALIIPAVVASREVARRSICSANIRQICLGLSNYMTTYGKLPRGTVNQSPHYSVLPFIGQQTLYETIQRYGVKPSRILSVTIAAATPGIFLCPSGTRGSPDSGLGWTSYAGNRGSGFQTYGNNGIFVGPSGTGISTADITDGTSNTVMISEWILGTEDPSVRQGLRTVYHTPTKLAGKEQLNEFAAICANLDPGTATVSPVVKGRNWLYGELGGTLYNHVLEPNANSCLNGTGVQIGAFSASSLHANGSNVGFVDGHVKFINSTISRSAWRNLGSRAGAELHEDDF